MSASSKNIILSKGDSADTKTGELQFVSATSGQGLGKVSFKNDATSTERSLKFSVDSNEVLINNKGYVGIGTTNPESSLTIKGNINNYKESNYPYRLTSLALNANGETNQYAQNDDSGGITATNFDGNSELTIEIWFKTTKSIDDAQCIFMKGNHGYGIYINNSTKQIAYTGTNNYNYDNSIKSSSNLYEVNKWQHLAVTVNKTTNSLKFYINGNIVDSKTETLRITDVWPGGGNNKSLYLGRQSTGENNFQGYLADLRIWNTELSQSTIQAWYDKDITSSHPNYANLGSRSWAFDFMYASINGNMAFVPINGAILNEYETWTDKIKSGKNVIGGFIAENSSKIKGHTILEGHVAINTSNISPTYHLHVNNHMYAPYISASQWVKVNGVTLDFTGGHTSITKEQYNKINNNNNIDLINDLSYYLNRIGYIVRSTGKYYNENSDIEREKPTINESIPIIELTKTEKDISSFGIISRTFEQNEVKRLIINSLGEGAIMVSNYNGNIINGHYITSSALEGLGMKQDSDSLKNYTVAKSTQDEDFTSDYQEITHTNGQTYRYKLIGCTYHCG